MKKKVVEFKEVTFKYKNKDMVLDHISFSIYQGEIISIIGENGSGKSTIGKLITRLLSPSEGNIYYFEKEYNKDIEIEIRKNFGLIFQNPDNQFIGNTVEDDVAFGLENKLVPSKNMQQIIDEKLNLVDMIEYKKYQPSNLSGGQKQRVAIASNLALNLSLLIFDESTSMLDPKGKEEVNNLIKQIKKDNPDMTLIIISHNMEEVLFSNRVLVLNNHHIEYDGTPDNLFKNKDLLTKFNITPPFKYELVHKLKYAGFAVDFDMILEEIKEKICQ